MVLERQPRRVSSDVVARFAQGRCPNVTGSVRGGKRRLAYPIQHQREGYYVTTKFRTSPAAAHGLDAQINLNDNVMRHLVIRLDPSKK